MRITNRGWLVACSLGLGLAGAASATSIQDIVRNPSGYVGSQVTLSGKVDRVLGSGDFLMGMADNPDQRILVFTSRPPEAKAGAKAPRPQQPPPQQRAGVALKEGQQVQVTGKVDALTVKNDYDILNFQKNRESFGEAVVSTPIIVVPQSNIKLQG